MKYEKGRSQDRPVMGISDFHPGEHPDDALSLGTEEGQQCDHQNIAHDGKGVDQIAEQTTHRDQPHGQQGEFGIVNFLFLNTPGIAVMHGGQHQIA